jgi:tripartite motif-containing protein 71
MFMSQMLVTTASRYSLPPVLSWDGWGYDGVNTGWHESGSGKTGVSGTEDGQFQSPYGVAVDASGNIYVSDSSNNRVQKFTSFGTFLGWWGYDGVNTGWHGPGSGKTGVSGTGDGQFQNPSDVAVDISGNVYVADGSSHRIQKFTSSGAFLGWWGNDGVNTGWHGPGSGVTGVWGTGDGQFQGPYGVTADASGNVYVADYGNNRIQKFTSSGTFLGWLGYDGVNTGWHEPGSGMTGVSGSGDGQFSYPYRVAVDTSGNVYVTEARNNRLQKFTSSGALLGWWGNGTVTSGWHEPGSGEIGVSGSGDEEFSVPCGVALDGFGNVYVADLFNYRIQKFGYPPETIQKSVGGEVIAANKFVLLAPWLVLCFILTACGTLLYFTRRK